MRCFDAAAIARAVTLGTDDPHFGECLECRRRLDADRAARAALGGLPVPALGPARRRELAAEILAAAQLAPAPRRGPRRTAAWAWGGGSAAALAAAVALVAAWPERVADEPVAPRLVSAESPAMRSATAAHDDPAPLLSAPQLEASGGAILQHLVGARRDVVTLVDGTLELDTRSARDVDVRVGDSIVHVDDAAVTIRARKRAIVSVQVIVGTARVDGGQQSVTLRRDSLWLPGPSAKQQSLDAFRRAWIALRAGHHREAMQLFDEVTDPVVLEEATYWAAVAARRSGDAAGASERFARFLRAFPASEYAAEIGNLRN